MTQKLTYRRANLQDPNETQLLAEIDMNIPPKFDADFVVNEKMIQERIDFYKALADTDFFEVVTDGDRNILAFHIIKKIPYFDRFAGRVDTLWVSPVLRRSGVASTLKKRGEEWARAQKLDHLYTWVHAENSSMISLNRKLGYDLVHFKMKKSFQNTEAPAAKDCEEKQIPTLRSQRITLRPFRLSDAKEVQRQAGSPKVAATTAVIPHPYPDGAAEEWISKHQVWFAKGQAVDWAIELNENGKLIGCISLGVNKSHNRAEVGYWIGEDSWNQGYCTEAARIAFKYAFEEMKLNKITSQHMLENPASGKVMEKAGMTKEGVLKQNFFKRDRFVDMVVYGLLKCDFENAKQEQVSHARTPRSEIAEKEEPK